MPAFVGRKRLPFILPATTDVVCRSVCVTPDATPAAPLRGVRLLPRHQRLPRSRCSRRLARHAYGQGADHRYARRSGGVIVFYAAP